MQMKTKVVLVMILSLTALAGCGGKEEAPMAEIRPHEMTLHGDMRIDNYFWLNEREKKFFEGNGVQVLAMDGLEFPDPEAIASVDPGRIYRMAKAIDHPDADAIFISCTDFRATEAIQALEQDLGKPVFSSNQVTLWAMLRLAGIKSPINGYGRLLESM